MKLYAQYGEEKILGEFFKDLGRPGYLIDVGAADGVLNSNSRWLIETKSWSGLLIEPNPDAVHDLRVLYAKTDGVQVTSLGVSDRCEYRDMFVYGRKPLQQQLSTTDIDFKHRVVGEHGDQYTRKCRVLCSTMRMIMDSYCEPQRVDFLSIDVEGSEFKVLDSIDWTRHSFGLICVEHSMPIKELDDKMHLQFGYVKYNRTRGNSFYMRQTVS